MKLQNPYVGPRAFEEEDSRNFFGRKEETRQLASLVISHRAVLLYAPSGAGKTSLLSAGLIPYLRQRKRINILPIARVGGDLPPGVDGKQVKNIYVFNTLLDLAGEETHSDVLVDQSLSEGLAAYFVPQSNQRRPRPCLLIVDQFEELFTTHPERYPERADFFFQIQHSLKEHPQLSLLLSMREDYIAQLDPYAAQLPNRLRTRFRLELLGEDAARQAVQQPARQGDVNFTDTAVEKLVNDLRKVQVQQPDGTTMEQLGRHIEPVQLQVVCRRLWEKLPEEAEQIGETDVEAVGDVDTALSDYYADRVKATAERTGIRERGIREWFDRHLITEQGIRGQVLKGPQQSQGLENKAISPLVDAHLVRAEKRLNATWYELAHDRLIEPVRTNNARWFQTHLSPLQRQAALWQEQGRSHGLLLRDEALADAETWAAEHQDELIPGEQEFLATCREARAQARRERRKNRFIQGLAVVATICLIVAVYFFVQANAQKAEAERQARIFLARGVVMYALQDNAQHNRERAALLVRQASFLNRRFDGGVDDQIEVAIHTIFRTSAIVEGPGHAATGAELLEMVCQNVDIKKALTPEEWEQFVGHDVDYEPACPELLDSQQIQLRSEKMMTTDIEALSLNLREDVGYGFPTVYISNDFKDLGKVIVDHATGLMWQKFGSKEQKTYQQAQAYVDELNSESFAGHVDWRLPTVEELWSLLEKERNSDGLSVEELWLRREKVSNPESILSGLYINSMFDEQQTWIWSSDVSQTKFERSPGLAWYVNLRWGIVFGCPLDYRRNVRAVRSWQNDGNSQ